MNERKAYRECDKRIGKPEEECLVTYSTGFRQARLLIIQLTSAFRLLCQVNCDDDCPDEERNSGPATDVDKFIII